MNGPKTYLLVQTEPRTGGIADRIRGLPGVVFAEDVRGPYDALALAADADGDGLRAILEEVRALPGVIRALAAPSRIAVGQPSTDAA